MYPPVGRPNYFINEITENLNFEICLPGFGLTSMNSVGLLNGIFSIGINRQLNGNYNCICTD